PEHGGRGGLASAAQLAQADPAVVRLDLDDGAHEAPPVAPVGVAQRGRQGDRDRGGADISDLHSDKLTLSPLRGKRAPPAPPPAGSRRGANRWMRPRAPM